jgi:ADP-ribose pyrophosphatase YjhB (NUDIX family)
MPYPFNVRVYGILINNEQQVLVTDELIQGREITKFPGGGLEFGESTIECLIRELKEEADMEIEVIKHFYTTDFFQVSAFNPNAQVISIYYLIRPLQGLTIPISIKPFDFPERIEGAINFRLISLKDISEEDFTFLIDKKVVGLLRTK